MEGVEAEAAPGGAACLSRCQSRGVASGRPTGVGRARMAGGRAAGWPDGKRRPSLLPALGGTRWGCGKGGAQELTVTSSLIRPCPVSRPGLLSSAYHGLWTWWRQSLGDQGRVIGRLGRRPWTAAAVICSAAGLAADEPGPADTSQWTHTRTWPGLEFSFVTQLLSLPFPSATHAFRSKLFGASSTRAPARDTSGLR